MPRVIVKTGFSGPDGREEEISEYICDSPGCPNVATQLLGCVPELRIYSAVCEEHAPKRQA